MIPLSHLSFAGCASKVPTQEKGYNKVLWPKGQCVSVCVCGGGGGGAGVQRPPGMTGISAISLI